MKTRLSVVAIALSTLFAGHALAADPAAPKTRADVKAELAEAIRNGDMVADGETGLTFKQLYPQRYAQPVVAGKTRAEVKAELAEAIRNGDMVADGETGLTFREMAPARYATANAQAVEKTAAVGKTRAEVKAELAEAIRNGDMVADGQTGLTYKQLYPGRYPQPALAQGKTRQDVRAELEQARRSSGG
jgi:predicted RNase H-like HicB family nuclease